MLILALDSTAVAASVALCENEREIASFHVKNGLTHSETILPMVEELLRRVHLNVEDVDLFAVSVGPGSFTGVRIGVATVKGLAFGKGKPVAAVSTLEALAQNAVPMEGILLCPVMNARRGQVYNALFHTKDGVPQRLTADRAISLNDLAAELSAMEKPIVLCGDGTALAAAAFQNDLQVVPLPELLTDQNAASVARCAYRMALRGETLSDAELAPIYLRLPQAERERLERLEAEKRKETI